MSFRYRKSVKEKWQKFSLIEQFANIGSEVSRAKSWQGKNEKLFWGAAERTLELFDFTLRDARWRGLKGRLKEIARAKELFCDAVLGGRDYKTSLEDLDKYFLYFGLLARRDF